MFDLILSAGRKILDGGFITKSEVFQISNVTGVDIYLLAAMASKIREKYHGNKVDLCSIINAKSGNCYEDCKFCAQSRFNNCSIKTYPLLDEDTILEYAHQMEKSGAHRFALVISGRGINENDKDFHVILKIIRRIRRETNMDICASLGELNQITAQMLKESGLSRYHHNLESSEDFFPYIVTTHTYQDRINTVKIAKSAGMEICSGGIIGLGEDIYQRCSLAFALRDIGVDSVPINILSRISGIRLENEKSISPLEIIKTIAEGVAQIRIR